MRDWLLTIDTDWAPVWVRQALWALLAPYSVKATVFATERLEEHLPGYEICPHPNLAGKPHDRASLRGEIARVMEQVRPSGRGLRNHGTIFPPDLEDACCDLGLAWLSNTAALRQAHLGPVRCRRLFDLPIFFTDGSWAASADYNLTSPGLKVFLFHPIHAYLNTYSPQHYQAAKQANWDRVKLEGLVNHTRFGAADFLAQVLAANAQRFSQSMGEFVAAQRLLPGGTGSEVSCHGR